MKSKLVLLMVGLLLLAGLAFVLLKRPTPEPAVKPKATEKKPTVVSVDELPSTEQPEVELTAISSCELKLVVSNLSGFTTVEHELLYNTASGVRGAIGTVRVRPGEKSIPREIVLGSESSGKRSCDKGVTGGTLNLTFRGEKSYRYSRDFSLVTTAGRVKVVMEE